MSSEEVTGQMPAPGNHEDVLRSQRGPQGDEVERPGRTTHQPTGVSERNGHDTPRQR